MSTFKVEILKINNWEKHFNADRLAILQIKGWNCITILENIEEKIKGNWVYFPIDSIIEEPLLSFLFPKDSKIRPLKGRIKTEKIRNCISQGLAIPVIELENFYPGLSNFKEGTDITSFLKYVRKYEPSINCIPKSMQGQTVKYSNINFKRYTDIQNYKNFINDNIFQEGESVYLSEKVHGSSVRMAFLPITINTWWKRLLNFLWLLPKHEYCLGSRKVQLQDKPNHKTFYDENIYEIISNQYQFKKLLKPNEAIFGEIVGPNVQGGYHYGFKQGEYGFFAYDVIINDKYLNYEDFKKWCDERNIPRVPDLGVIPFNIKELDKLRKGDSLIGGQKIREGIVIKPIKERYDPKIGRVVLKFINDDYLVQKNLTEFH